MITLTLADRSRGWLGELVVDAGEALASKLASTGGSAAASGAGPAASGVGPAVSGVGPAVSGVGPAASARELARGCFRGFPDLPSPENCRIALTPLGEIVAAAWRDRCRRLARDQRQLAGS